MVARRYGDTDYDPDEERPIDAQTYACPTCNGTGEIEASEEGTLYVFECPRCEGDGLQREENR